MLPIQVILAGSKRALGSPAMATCQEAGCVSASTDPSRGLVLVSRLATVNPPAPGSTYLISLGPGSGANLSFAHPSIMSARR
jgi:hypothetical protein